MLAGCTEGFPRVQAPHSRILGPAALFFYKGIEHPRIWVMEPTPHGSRGTSVILNYGTLLEEEFQGEGGRLENIGSRGRGAREEGESF